MLSFQEFAQYVLSDTRLYLHVGYFAYTILFDRYNFKTAYCVETISTQIFHKTISFMDKHRLLAYDSMYVVGFVFEFPE